MNLRNASALAGLFALLVAGCSGSKPPVEEALVTVNGVSIPKNEYYARLERKPRVTVLSQQGPQMATVAGSLGSQMLQDLINEEIMLQLVKEDNNVPTEADIKAELDNQEKENPKFISTLAAQGVSLDDIKHQIKLALVQERLITKGVTVTAAEIDKVIKDNPTRFADPEKATMLWIGVSDATKKGLVDKDLKGGQDFRTVALRYTDSPQAKQNGAAFDIEVVQQLPPDIQVAVQKTPENKATDWINIQGMWVKFFIQKKTPAKKWEITPEVRKRVQRELAAQRGQATNDVNKRVFEKLNKSKIDVTPKYLREPWEKQLAEIKSQMAQQEAAMRGIPPAGAPGTAPGTAPGAGPGTTPGAPGGAPGGAPVPKTGQ